MVSISTTASGKKTITTEANLLRYVDGEVYDDEWNEGRKHGRGKLTFANGDVYEGQWKHSTLPLGPDRDANMLHALRGGDQLRRLRPAVCPPVPPVETSQSAVDTALGVLVVNEL